MQAHGVLDLRDRGKREGIKALCSKCIFTCVMEGPVCCVWPLSFCYLMFPAAMLVDQHQTVENMLPNPSWKSLTSAAAKQMGSVSKCVLKQISVSGHQKSKPQARTWKGREWARKELAINSFADLDIRKAKTQFQWQKIIVSSLISVVVGLKCLNLSAWAPFTETVLNYMECHCAVT